MNLIDDEEVNNKNNKKSKIIMRIIIVCIVLLIILSIALIYMINNIKTSMLKIVIDDKSISKFSEDIFVKEDDTIYVAIKDFSALVDYLSYNGDHKSESTNKGYIVNNYEEVSFTMNSNKIYKTLISGEDGEYFTINKPVKMINDKLYMDIDGIKLATNCTIAYNAKNNKYTIYTLPYLVSYYGTRIADSALAGDGSDFNNEKAVLYNMMLTKNINEKYGVKSLDGKEIIGEKYASIKFVENSQDFIVKTDDGKMGILASNGTTKIQPDYDEIKQIDKQQSLYLVKRNNKYGVISENGNIIIHLEYDQIGIDTTQFSEFSSQNIKKQYVLFEKCIPVQRDKKWGLYDKTGKQILPIEYEQLGCTSSTQNVTTSNSSVLTLHDYEAIIVYKNKKYGIIDATGKVLIPCVLDSVYSITAEGKESYYMVQGLNDAIDIERYFTQQGIKKKSQQEISIVDEALNKTTNTVTNTVANSANNTATGTMNTINTTTNN